MTTNWKNKRIIISDLEIFADTHIDGNDDVDEHGKVVRRGELHTVNGEKSRKAQVSTLKKENSKHEENDFQEEMNQAWLDSLRS